MPHGICIETRQFISAARFGNIHVAGCGVGQPWCLDQNVIVELSRLIVASSACQQQLLSGVRALNTCDLSRVFCLTPPGMHTSLEGMACWMFQPHGGEEKPS